jgi:hypothetical protein
MRCLLETVLPLTTHVLLKAPIGLCLEELASFDVSYSLVRVLYCGDPVLLLIRFGVEEGTVELDYTAEGEP